MYHTLHKSVDHGINPMHSQSQNHPINLVSGEIIAHSSITKQGGKKDLLQMYETLPEKSGQLKSHFIKSVDESNFAKLKKSSDNAVRGASNGAIAHVGQGNPFMHHNNSIVMANQQHVRSSTITSKPRKKKVKRNDSRMIQHSLESS